MQQQSVINTTANNAMHVVKAWIMPSKMRESVICTQFA
jgi:hypothetical protein